ncbi:flagellar protein [Rhizobium sp. XQZ8]|uniref:flagellar protein n=1 Tax=Rhizobium populisoli TaxID=2859785 RepID=UPI001CA54F4E|nr:flagellar protein [Rhizobium populisoli]MBW6420713.1 flagellar protein [Rhizobium populisoli]
MSDQKKEDVVSAQQAEEAASRLGDKVLMATGVALAAASAFFPWYVFLNADKFGVRTEDFGRTRDLPPGIGRPVVTVSPLAMTDSSKDDWVKMDPMDGLTTATTTSALGETKQNGNIREEQPFPGKSNFRLLHVANGRALIEDSSGMYMVRVGSILPDNSKLATLEQRSGRWVIITSSGAVYQDAGAARP